MILGIVKITFFLCSCFVTYLSWKISRSWTYPPFVYSSVWLVCLTIIFMMGDYFYQLSLASILLYVFGVLFFFFGGLTTLYLKPKILSIPIIIYSDSQRKLSLFYLKAIIILCLIMMPAYWSYISNLAGSSSLVNIRYFLVNDYQAQGISFYANIPILASLCFTACLLELQNKNFSKIYTVLIGMCAIIMLSMSGSKMGFVTIIMMWIICSVTLSNKINLKTFIPLLIIIIAGFIAGLWFINLRGGVDSDFDLISIFRIIASYFLGGIVAFDQVLNNPDLYAANQSMIRFFIETYAKLGGEVDLASINAQYTNINEYENTNTYTHFYTYFLDIGAIGSLFTIMFLGAFTSYFWMHVNYKNPIIFFMHTSFILSLIFTIYSEKIFLGINPTIKMIIFTIFLYYLIPIIHNSVKSLLSDKNL